MRKITLVFSIVMLCMLSSTMAWADNVIFDGTSGSAMSKTGGLVTFHLNDWKHYRTLLGSDKYYYIDANKSATISWETPAGVFVSVSKVEFVGYCQGRNHSSSLTTTQNSTSQTIFNSNSSSTKSFSFSPSLSTDDVIKISNGGGEMDVTKLTITYTVNDLRQNYYFKLVAQSGLGGTANVRLGSGSANTMLTTYVLGYNQATASVIYTASYRSGYKFLGWAEDGTSTIISVANPYTFDAVSTSTDSSNPSVTTLCAKFAALTEEELEKNICFDKYYQAEAHLGLSTRKPSAMESQLNGDYYYGGEGSYVDFKTSSGEIFLNVGSLNAARYSLTVWEVKASNSYANIYKKGASGAETISYGGGTYARIARIDMRKEDNTNAPIAFYTRTKENILLEQGDYIIGLEGGEGAAFDQILVEATTPVFCGSAFYHLACYDTDATSGDREGLCDLQSVLCSEASTTPVTVPAPPIAPEGYHFAGWNTRLDKRGMRFEAGQQLTLPTVHTDKYYVMALYADWQPDEIHITLDKNGAAADGEATILFEQKKTTALTPVTGEPGGQVLLGYYNQPDGGAKVLSTDGSVAPSVTGLTDRFSRWIKSTSTTLYAHFGSTYTVTFSHGEHGELHVYDDMGNRLSSGCTVPEGTVISLQARPDHGYMVGSWTGVDGVGDNHNTVVRLTVSKNETISLTFVEGEVEVCLDTRIIQCEDTATNGFVGIGGTWGGSTSGTNGQHPKQSPTSLKVGNSQQYCNGFTGSGYIDFDNAGGEREIYYRVNIPEAGEYRITVYSNNSGTRNVNFYHRNTGNGTTYWVQPKGDSKFYRQGLSFQTLDDNGNDLTSASGKFTMSQTGEYLIGLNGKAWAKWDRIVITRVDGKHVFCPETHESTISSFPWNDGTALMNSDRVHLDKDGFVGCVTKVQIDVKGTTGDLYKVECNNVVLLDNVEPGILEIEMTDDIRTYGLDIISKSSVATANAAVYGGTPRDGFYVQGNTLYDANGIPFIMRGTNVAHCWLNDEQPTLEALEHIADYGANTVRIVLSDGEVNKDGTRWARTPVREISQIISKCEELGLACVLEVHDALGVDDVAKLNLAVNYWLEIKSALVGHEKSVIINIANEWYGSQTTTDAKRNAWKNAYVDAISRLRSAGLKHCIMIDCPGWGQYAAVLKESQTREILQSDPYKNVCFSIHMYAEFGTEAKVKTAIDDAMARNICVVVGEYGWAHANGSNTDPVDYQAIINYTNERRVGALQWSWYGNSGGVEYLDMADLHHNLKTYTSPRTGANWGPDVVNNSWNKPFVKPSTVYNVEDVMQLRSVTLLTDEQDYLVWDGVDPLSVNVAQVAVGPEHFSSANPGDRLAVFVRNVGASAEGRVYQTDASTTMGAPVAISPTDGLYEYVLTAEDLEEAKDNGLVVRGTNYAIESIELRAANCHMMRVAADTIRVTTPLAIGSDYRNTFDFGNWEHLLNFRPAAFANLTEGNILRFRITPSAGFDWDDTRVAYRCYAGNATIDGVNTMGDISFEHTISNLGGAVPDRQGFVDIRVTAEVLSRLQNHGLVVFGKNAKMHYFTVIGDTFIVPADSATLVPECGIDNLIIYQGGQVINQSDVVVYKKISYVRQAVGNYTYCAFDDATTENFKGQGGTYQNQINQWYTFTTPFDVTRVEAYDEGGYWDINPVWDNHGSNADGYFYMEYLSDDNAEATNDRFQARWTKIASQYPKRGVPYIVLFSSEHGFGDYFVENPMITYSANISPGTPLVISGRQNAVRELPEEGAKKYYLFENNTLYDMSFDGSSAYVLNEDGSEFVLTDNAVVHPFECYLQATSSFKSSHPRFSFRMLDSGEVATGVENVEQLLLLNDPETRVYDVLGRELSVRALPHGQVVILVNGAQTTKLFIP